MGNRVLVGVLAAVDAAVAAAAGLAAVLAPLTLLWVFGFGDRAVWGALWPAAGRVWQLGHLVPVDVVLPAEYRVAAGVPADAAAFTISLAPLALACFTAVFAARSGRRAAAAGAAGTGVVTGAVVFAAIAAAVLVTTANPVATVTPWPAVALPAAVFVVPAVLGALVGAWRDGNDGVVDRLRERLGPRWEGVPAAVARGAGLALAAIAAVAAVVVAALLAVRLGDVVALFQAGRADALGATVLTLGQVGYLPTLVTWAAAFVAGPGFAIGTGTTVSPGVSQLPLVPGIPVLGAIPDTSSPWLLLVGLVPVALGAIAAHRARRDLGPGLGPRIVTALGIALVAAAAAGVVARCAAGSLGPGTLVSVGPDALAVAIAIGVEVLIGAAISLLVPGRPDVDDLAEEVPSRVDREPVLARGAGGVAPLG